MELLSTDEIKSRVAAAMSGGGAVPSTLPPGPAPATTYVKNLGQVSESLIDALNMGDGMKLGLTEIDVLTRGFRKTDLVFVTGFTHSSKTQIMLTMIVNNPDKHILFFSYDDPAEMILAKLVAMQTGVPAVRLEQGVRAGDDDCAALIREVATEKFPNLLIVDDAWSLAHMRRAQAEATEVWGYDPDAMIIDYLEMVPSEDDEDGRVKKLATDLKRWANEAPCPLFVVHQGTKTNASPGEPLNLKSMAYSGEQQGTIILGARRKRDNEKLSLDERERVHADTITIHVVKNKRPGGKVTPPDGVDYFMEWETGSIRPLTENERRRVQGKPPAPSAVFDRQPQQKTPRWDEEAQMEVF